MGPRVTEEAAIGEGAFGGAVAFAQGGRTVLPALRSDPAAARPQGVRRSDPAAARPLGERTIVFALARGANTGIYAAKERFELVLLRPVTPIPEALVKNVRVWPRDLIHARTSRKRGDEPRLPPIVWGNWPKRLVCILSTQTITTGEAR